MTSFSASLTDCSSGKTAATSRLKEDKVGPLAEALRVPALFRAAEQLPEVVLRPEIVIDGVLRFLLHRPFAPSGSTYGR
jgi:hypothetical protein